MHFPMNELRLSMWSPTKNGKGHFIFSLPAGSHQFLPNSRRWTNEWLEASLSPSLPRSMGCHLSKSSSSRKKYYTEWNRNPRAKIHEKNVCHITFLPSLAKHLFWAIIHHRRPPPRPWCASDSVHGRGLDGGRVVRPRSRATPSSRQKKGYPRVTSASADPPCPHQNP